MDCTCTKAIGEDLGKGQVPKTAAEVLAGSGLFKVTETSIQYLGGVGTRAKNEVGNWTSPEICPEHTPHEVLKPQPATKPETKSEPAPGAKSPTPTEGDE